MFNENIISEKKKNLKKTRYISKQQKIKLFKYFFIIKTILLSILFSCIFIFKFITLNKKEKEKDKDIYQNLQISNSEDDKKCYELDPINIFENRLKNGPTTLCKNGNSEHVCYFSRNVIYKEKYHIKNGVICKMNNIILDPTKSQQSGYIYKGPVDTKNGGSPILLNGFFNMNIIMKKKK